MINIDVGNYDDVERTIAVKELIEHLQTLDPDEQICATWEGVHAPILIENFE